MIVGASVAVFAIAFGLIILLAGVVSLGGPLTGIGVKSRNIALGTIAAGFAFMLLGAAMLLAAT